jgi:hypothetical protein
MMGERRVMQEALFYGFSLERHVPDNHLLRKIDRFVDLTGLGAHLGPYYSDVGRPSIDPEGLKSAALIVVTTATPARRPRGSSTQFVDTGRLRTCRCDKSFFLCPGHRVIIPGISRRPLSSRR